MWYLKGLKVTRIQCWFWKMGSIDNAVLLMDSESGWKFSPSLFVIDRAFWWCSLHIRSWYYHLLPVNLVTYEMFQSVQFCKPCPILFQNVLLAYNKHISKNQLKLQNDLFSFSVFCRAFPLFFLSHWGCSFISSTRRTDPKTYIFFFYLFRVFLRAINQYAEVLNKKFLDQTNFELQVRSESWNTLNTSSPTMKDFLISQAILLISRASQHL